MGVKEFAKALANKHYEAKYSVIVKDKDVSFDAWIRGKEMHLERFDMSVQPDKSRSVDIRSYATRYGASTVRIIPYSTVEKGFSVKPYLEDVLIFVDGEVTDKAIPLIVQKFNANSDVNIIYGDEDIADTYDLEEGRYGQTVPDTRHNPYFKPDWSPNSFISHFYFCNIVALRRSAFREVEWNRDLSGATAIYRTLIEYIFSSEFNLRKTVCHISEILVHAKDYENNSLTDGLAIQKSNKLKVRSYGPEGYGNLNRTTLTVVIPSKDNPTMLKRCIESLLDACPGHIIPQIYVVDNGSSEENKSLIVDLSAQLCFTYEYSKNEFNFAHMCNKGVSFGAGEYVLLLNDDVYFTEAYTLEAMIEQASYRFVGAVGAKLLYPDSHMIQHAGVVNNRIGPVHKLQFMDDSVSHYFGYNRYANNVLAVTGACLMVRREVFEKYNGLNEDFRVAFNDVDFCFRLHEAGYYNVTCNQISLCHAESVSRGKDTDKNSLKRLLWEKAHLYDEHPALKGNDPYYNKYLQTNCLETRIHPAISDATATKCSFGKIRLSNAREEACVNFNLEYCGLYRDFTNDKEMHKELILFEGFSFVMGSDNALYKKTLLLRNGNVCYGIDITDSVIRNDVRNNCSDQKNVALSGFNVYIDSTFLPTGNYEVGILCSKYFSEEKLYKFSNRELVVE